MKKIVRLMSLIVAASPCLLFADYASSDVISLNITINAGEMSGLGDTVTLAGNLPDNSWYDTDTVNAARRVSGDARNGYVEGVTAWDGANQTITTLPNVVFSWAVEGSGVANYGNKSGASPAFLNAWLARASGAQTDAAIELQNIPYERYDVIVYLSGADSGATPAYRAVCVNGIPYKGDTTAENGTTYASSVGDTWGTQQGEIQLGVNALKVAGLTASDLVITMRNAGGLSRDGQSDAQGIAAIQIVRDMTAIGQDTRPVASGKVISVNLQSAYNGNGTKPDYLGLEKVPIAAWTDDGLSSADEVDVDVDVTLKEWDGATEQIAGLSGVKLHEKAANAWSWYSSYVPMPNVLIPYMDDGGKRAQITVTGIEYKKYDVIVYTATDTAGNNFGPVTVNGRHYRYSLADGMTVEASEANSTSDTRWGFSRARTLTYGANALRIKDQVSPTLTITGANNANNARGCIAAFQIVDTYDPDEVEVREFDDGDVCVIDAALDDLIKLVCDGDLTIEGTEGYKVVNSDIEKLLIDDVTGTVTLGANTVYETDDTRTIELPDGFEFGEGSAVAITETQAEYAKDIFQASGIPDGVSYVLLKRYDGTEVLLAVAGGEVSRGDGTDVKVKGLAALYDFEFEGSLATSGSRISATLGQDGEPAYETSENDMGVVARPAYPYIGLTSTMPAWNEFSTVLICKMPSDAKKGLISFGNGWDKILFLATGEEENKVIVGYGDNSEASVLTTMTVPNASTARHFYAFVLSENKTRLTIYLDGVKWDSVTNADGFRLGSTSQNSGIQIGKGYAVNPAGYGSANDGVFYSLLIYDYILSNEQIAALKELYPYAPAAGAFSREVAGAVDFETVDYTWTKAGEDEPAYTVPADGAAIDLVATADSEVTVNAEVTSDSLVLSGDGAITLKKGAGLLHCAGMATIATDVTIEYGAAEISGAPTVIADGATLTFDYSGYDMAGSNLGTLIPLTGPIDEKAEGVVACTLPDTVPLWQICELVYTEGRYQLEVGLAHSARNVYLPLNTATFADDTEVYWQEDEDTVYGYASPYDTVCLSDDSEVILARDTPVAGYDFGEFGGSLVFNVGEGESDTLNVAGSGTVVKTGAGTLVFAGADTVGLDIQGGFVDLGSNRPSSIGFAEGASVKLVLADWSESSVTIPYTGTPDENAVAVYEPDGTTPCSIASVAFEDGNMVVSVAIPSFAMANPVTGAEQTFSYRFAGNEDGSWANTANWEALSNNRQVAYEGSLAPALPNSALTPVLFNGDDMPVERMEDGYKKVTLDVTAEGWEFKIGVCNGAFVNMSGGLKKLQNGCWIMVDSTSKLVIGPKNSGGNNGNAVDFYVAAKDGVEFTTNFSFNNTLNYYLAGDGSVKFDAALVNGTHNICQVRVNVGDDSDPMGIVTRKLVDFPVGSNRTFQNLSDASVDALDRDDVTMAQAADADSLADVGDYILVQEEDGVYIKFVGYAVDAEPIAGDDALVVDVGGVPVAFEASGDTLTATVPEGTTSDEIAVTAVSGDDITSAFTVVVEGTVATLTLNDVEFEAAADPDEELWSIDGDTVTLNVTLIPGLYYAADSSATLDGLECPEEKVLATSETVLTVPKPEGNAGFFKVWASLEP